MSQKNDGGPAFPLRPDWTQNRGLSKRELFAAMAMQGLLTRWNVAHPIVGPMAQTLAPIAIGFADALLEELQK